MIIPEEQDLLGLSDWNYQKDLLFETPISIFHSMQGSTARDFTHFYTRIQGTSMVAKWKQRDKYEPSRARVYVRNEGTARMRTARSDMRSDPLRGKKKKIRKLRKRTKPFSFQTSKYIQTQNQKQKLWAFKSDLRKSVLCLFPFSFTV